MKVSIITVTYNSEKWLEECILSVIRQTYNNIEHIIIDGGSVDNTLKIIDNHKSNIDLFVSEPDKGIYDAINKGIKISSGEIIGLLHSDDMFYDCDVISRIVSSFSNNIDAVYSDSIFINFNTNKKTRHYSSKFFKNNLFRFGLMPSHPTFYIKSTILKSFPLYSLKYRIASDFDLLLRHFLIYNLSVVYVKDIWVIMREGGISTSGYKSKMAITSEILLSCKQNGIYTNKFMLSLRYLIKLTGYFI